MLVLSGAADLLLSVRRNSFARYQWKPTPIAGPLKLALWILPPDFMM
jgi:hypothetical protein